MNEEYVPMTKAEFIAAIAEAVQQGVIASIKADRDATITQAFVGGVNPSSAYYMDARISQVDNGFLVNYSHNEGAKYQSKTIYAEDLLTAKSLLQSLIGTP